MIVFEIKLLYRRTAHFQVQLAADLEHRSVSPFGVQPHAVHAPEVTVFGIQLREFGGASRTLPVSGAGKDQPMEFFKRLTLIQKPESKPVEEVRVGWQRPHMPKIIGRFHKPSPEMIVPHPV